MRAQEPGLFTRFTRSGPYVVALQSLTIWLASWAHIKRVANQVFCATEPDPYPRHLLSLRELVADYPCSESGHRRSGFLSGVAYFAARPLLAVRWHSIASWKRAEAHCWVVVAAVIVALGSSAASAALLLQAGTPIHYRPLRIVVHILLASISATAWATLWHAWLPCSRTLRRTGVGRRAAVTSACGESLGPHGADATRRGVALTALAAEGRVAAARLETAADAGAGWLGIGSLAPALGLVTNGAKETGVGKRLQGGAAGAGARSRRAVSAAEAVQLEGGGGVKKLRRRRAVVLGPGRMPDGQQPCYDTVDCDVSSAFTGGSCASMASLCGDGKDNRSSSRARGGCAPLVCSPAPLTSQRLPPWLLALLGRPSTGCSGATADLPGQGLAPPLLRQQQQPRRPGGRQLLGGWGAHRDGVRERVWRACGWAPAEERHHPSGAGAGARRLRFTSQVRREVLRVRIVGADPEQLPTDWRDLVFAHFNGSDCGCGGALDGTASARFLASGVAVRRGSIFLTVSLVQLPSQHDGGEGPGGAGHRPAAGARSGGSPSASVAAGDADGRRPTAEPARRDIRDVRGSTEEVEGGQVEPEGATGVARHPAPRAMPLMLQDQPARQRLHPLAQSGSAGADGEHVIGAIPVDAASISAFAAASRSVDGPEGGHTRPPAQIGGVSCDAVYPAVGSGHGHLSSRIQPAAAAGPDGGVGGACAALLTPPPPSPVFAPARRRIAGVWRAERHMILHSTSPASTPGNSNNPLHVLGPVVAGSLWSGGPLPAGPPGPPLAAAGVATSPASTPASPAPGLGQGGVLLQPPPPQPMRYTPLFSPAQQLSICSGSGPYGPAMAITGGSSPWAFPIDPPPPPQPPHPSPHSHGQPYRAAATGAPSSVGAVSSLTAGAVRTGGSATVSMQVAQMLDAMQLRSRDFTVSAASREARAGCAQSVLSAVSQLDGGIPLHLRQVLATEGIEEASGGGGGAGGGEAAATGETPSSSWEVEGVYERPMPPPQHQQRQATSPFQQQGVRQQMQQQQHQGRRWAEELTGNGLLVLSDAPSPPPLPVEAGQVAAGLGIVAAGLPGRGGALAADVAQPPVALPAQAGYQPASTVGFTAPALQPGGVAAGWGAASSAAVWPSHTAGLEVLADPASLPVRDVAVKPVLICKAPLLCAAAAGDLAASIPAAVAPATSATGGGVTPSAAAAAAVNTDGNDVGATAASIPGGGGPASELNLSLLCAPATVSELSVMLRYCGPASVFGEQTYLPVQLQLDSSSPAVAAAIRLQAAASDRDRRGGGDTQAARDVAEAATDPLPAHATVRTVLAGLACPGVLYVELWHGPQLCACLPVLLLPESAAGWAHEVCSLWQQQAEEGEAAAAVTQGGGGRACAAAIPAAAHQVVEDLGGWLTYAAHKRYATERAAAAAAAAAAYHSMGVLQQPPQYYQMVGVGGGAVGSTISTATISPPQFLDDWFSGWVVDMIQADAALSPPAAIAAVAAGPTALAGGAAGGPAPPPHPRSQPPAPTPAGAAAGAASSGGVNNNSYAPYNAVHDAGGGAAATAAAAAASCNRELFHDMMLQEGYNWLADCVEAGCCGLAEALMESLLAVGCTAAEVLRTCRSADGLPLIHAATLSGNPVMTDLVWGWGLAIGADTLGWVPPTRPRGATAASMEAALVGGTAAVAAAGAAGPAVAMAPAAAAAASAALHAAPPPAALGLAAGRSSSATALATAAPGVATDTRTPATVCSSSDAEVARFAAHNRPAVYGWGPDKPTAALRALVAAVRGLSAATHARAKALCSSASGTALRQCTRPVAGGSLASRIAGAWSQPAAVAAAVARLRSGGSGGVAAAIASAAAVATRLAQGPARGAASRTAVLPDGGLGSSGSGGGVAGGGSSWLRGWRQRWEAMRRVGLAALRSADAALMGLHAAVLRANPMHEDSGEEQRFLSHFQHRHGWVFSAWCWSMIPLYGLIGWRYVQERQWGQLALTPLWMWMYVLCAAADLAGATAAYRRRTEALAAAMHLSHSLSKALRCTGLPSYPVPPGKLYWLDVLACSTLSALCEPVRICVACPLRLVNCAVSTLLYRFTDTAPTYLEAMLLSASCHGFGLLMQNAVETHHRRSFKALQQNGRAGGATGADAGATAGRGAAVRSAKAALRRSASGGGVDGVAAFADTAGAAAPPAAATAALEQLSGSAPASAPLDPLRPPSLALPLTPSSRSAAAQPHTSPDEGDLGQTSPSAVGTAAGAAAEATGAEAAAAIAAAASPLLPLMTSPRYTSDFGELTRLLERDGGRNRGRGLSGSTGGAGGGFGLGLRLGVLDAPVVNPREDFLLPDAVWEAPDGPVGSGTWSSSLPYDCSLPPKGLPASGGAAHQPPPQPRLWAQGPSSAAAPPLAPVRQQEQQRPRQVSEASVCVGPLEGGEVPGREARQVLFGGEEELLEVAGREGSVRFRRPLELPSQQLPLEPRASPAGLSEPIAPAAAAVGRPQAAAAEAAYAAEVGPAAPSAAAADAEATTRGMRGSSGGDSNGSSRSGRSRSGRRHSGGSGRRGGSGSAWDTRPSRSGESGRGSESGSARASSGSTSNCDGGGSGCSIKESGVTSGRGNSGGLRQLVSRARGWMAAVRRRALRGLGSGRRKASRSG